MSVTGKRGIGVPTVLLYEGEGFNVTVETKTGDVYFGLLVESEDNMNVYLRNVKHTDPSGKKTSLEMVYLRGTQVCMFILPDLLAHAPMFKRITKFKESKRRFVPQGSGTERAGLMEGGGGQDGGGGRGGGFGGGRGGGRGGFGGDRR